MKRLIALAAVAVLVAAVAWNGGADINGTLYERGIEFLSVKDSSATATNTTGLGFVTPTLTLPHDSAASADWTVHKRFIDFHTGQPLVVTVFFELTTNASAGDSVIFDLSADIAGSGDAPSTSVVESETVSVEGFTTGKLYSTTITWDSFTEPTTYPALMFMRLERDYALSADDHDHDIRLHGVTVGLQDMTIIP